MVFNTISFLILFLLLYTLYWKLPLIVSGISLSIESRKWMLLFASFVFYGWWSIPFLIHFANFVALNYLIYFFVDRPSKRMIAILVSLNLIHLAFFKYFYFLVSLTFNQSFIEYVSPASGIVPEIILPLGISFYTFQIMAFHIDKYRGDIDYPVSMKDFVLFIMFFPQLVAGPIMRHNEFLPYIKKPVQLRKNWVDKGIFLFLIGVTKKVLVADIISVAIDPVFSDPASFSARANLIALYGFAIQIYMDFSGYSDMARGLAYLLGYRIPVNFAAPYFSESFREFWRRWHITLSQWLRDYLYVSLGGNRVSKARTYFNLSATMVLGGLWHGANLTFLVWGALHGFYLVVERALKLFPKPNERLFVKIVRAVIVFHLVLLAWSFFRADSISTAFQMIQAITTSAATQDIKFAMKVEWLLGIVVIMHIYEYRPRWFVKVWQWRAFVLPAASVVIGFAILSFATASVPFIYFQF